MKAATSQQAQTSAQTQTQAQTDETCLRDYIHVQDLARAHVLALEQLLGRSANRPKVRQLQVYNIGTGKPMSTNEAIDAFCQVNKITIQKCMQDARPGDVHASWADVSKAKKELGFTSRIQGAEIFRL